MFDLKSKKGDERMASYNYVITNDADILKLRHTLIERVCRLAWDGNLNEETKEALVREMIPGPKPAWRCCVHKERAIIRERIRLACGQNTSSNPDSKLQVQVIDAACDECPLSAYSVTDNCRFCLGKACLNNCRFNAIEPGEVRMHIDASKCKECGLCAKACPFEAIVHLTRPCKRVCPVGAITYDEYGYCKIDEKKCIQCGHCIHSCPFGAISAKSYLVPIIEAIRSGKQVYAMCAPALEGQYGPGVTMASIREALQRIGFADMVEVGLGGDMTAAYESEEWSEAFKEGRKMTTSCCPAFVNMLIKHFPEQYKNNMSTTITPMWAVSRYLKAIHPDCVTVFIGPCVAKKAESMDPDLEGNADYVMTFGEFFMLMQSRDIIFEAPAEGYQESSLWGKGFASSGGVANAVMECMRERGEDTSNIKLLAAAGAKECYAALMQLKMGRLKEDFIEGMVCPGGCVSGPSKVVSEAEVTRSRTKLFQQADKREILENLKNYPMDKFSMHSKKTSV